MSDWVHCNKCSMRHHSQASFFLVECGHIFCQRCVERIKTSKKCIICNKAGQVILLNKDVEPNVLDFFLPLENHIKKSIEIYKFQVQHRQTLFQNLLEKYNYAKKEFINCNNANKKLMKENHMLRSMLRTSGQNPQRFLTSTPMSNSSGNVTFQNSSIMSSIPPNMAATPAGHNHKMFPGYPKRNNIFNSGSSQGPSPAQMVPLGHRKNLEPSIHRNSTLGTMSSLEELRRSGKLQ